MGNVLVNKLEQNWRKYSPGIKVQRPLGGNIRKMGSKRVGVIPNYLNSGRKMTFSKYINMYMDDIVEFAAPTSPMQPPGLSNTPLHPFQFMSYDDLQKLSPDQFNSLQQQYTPPEAPTPSTEFDMANMPARGQAPRMNLIDVDPETRRKIQEQRKQRELGLASIRETRGWVNTGTGVAREVRSSARALGLDGELRNTVRRSLNIGMGNE